MIRGNVFFEVEKIEQLALINRLTTHHDLRPSLKASDDGIMIRQYSRGLFQQHRPQAVIPPTRPCDGSVVSSLHCMNDPQPEGRMASHIERRKFLATLGGAALWPLAARAQQPAMPVIGLLEIRSPDIIADRLRAFRQGLRETGYVEGENLAIEYRWTEGRMDRLSAVAAELVR